MRLLQVIPYYIPAIAYGGLVPLIHGCARALVERGHEVTVYTTDALDRSGRQPAGGRAPVSVDGVRVHYFPNLSNALAYDNRAFLPAGMVGRALAEVGGFDAVHLHDFYTLPNVLVARLARLHGVPFVVSPHGAFPPVPQRGKVLRKKLFLALFGSLLLERSRRVVVTSAGERAECLDAGLSPGHVVNFGSGVPDAAFAALPPRGALRRTLNIPADAPVALFFGRVDPVKGLDLLLPAFAAAGAAAHLVVAGPDFGALSGLVAQARALGLAARVHFLPMISDLRERRQLFADADLFCLPSRSEGFPVSVMELLAAGLPGVVSQACHFPELETAGAGRVVSLEPAALTQALRELLDDPARRARAGAAARAMAYEKFRLSQVVDRLERLYAELSGAPALAPEIAR